MTQGSDVLVCALCAEPDPLDLGVCPQCASAREGRAETLVFLAKPPGVRERDENHARLVALLGERAGGEGGRRVAAGRKPLLQAAAGTAARVARRLEERGMPAVALPSESAWRRMPGHFFLMMAVVLIAGTAAGTQAVLFALMTPAMVAALLAAAQLGMRQPLIASGKRSLTNPAVEARLIETVSELPLGRARTLLIDLVRLTQPLLVALERNDPGDLADSLPELLDAACVTALEIERLDAALAVLNRRIAGAADGESLQDAAVASARSRETGVRRMVEAIAVVGQLGGGPVASSVEAGERLSEVTRELGAQARAQEEAAKEMERLLSGSADGQRV